MDAELVREVYAAFAGNGDAGAAKTVALFECLGRHGPAGELAVNLYRAAKSSERAKRYRGHRYRGAAYDRKGWALTLLCGALAIHAGALGLAWGWGEDAAQPVHRFVLYVDLPTGQVSFHAGERGEGPAYAGQWDGVRGAGPGRICAWIIRLLSAEPERIAA